MNSEQANAPPRPPRRPRAQAGASESSISPTTSESAPSTSIAPGRNDARRRDNVRSHFDDDGDIPEIPTLQTEAIEVTHVSDPPAKAIRTKVMSLGEIQQDNVVRYPGVTPDGIDISVFTSHIPPLHECVDKDEKWDIDFLITELAKMDEE